MNKNKIIIGILIVVLVAIVGIMIFLFVTKDQAAIDIAKGKEEQEDSTINENDLIMAEREMFEDPYPGSEIAVMEIKDYGTIKIKFYDDVAPKAVENFKGLAKKGYYNNVTFHRVIEDFMIQGGDPTGIGSGGESFFGSDFGPEYKDGYFPYRGTLCMASMPGVENSLSSQFFIVQAGPEIVRSGATDSKDEKLPSSIERLYMEKGGTPHLYKAHTVFGYVFEGMDVVDKIAKTKTSTEESTKDKPLKDVIIKSVKIEEVKV